MKKEHPITVTWHSEFGGTHQVHLLFIEPKMQKEDILCFKVCVLLS